MTLNENHRRAILAAFRTIDKLLEDVESARARASSPFSRVFNDLTTTQQQVIGDYVAAIRDRMTDALKALETSARPPETAASWAIETALAFAQITVQEIAPSRLHGYGPFDNEDSVLIERLNADLERSIRRLNTYLRAGLGKDLAARLERLEAAPADLDLLRRLERIIRERGLIEYHGALQALLERLESKTFEIALFGKVSSGKSSLLNAVLGSEALPVGVTPVTAVPTRITWGNSPSAQIRFANALDEEIQLGRLAEFVSETQNPENSKRVARALVRLPSPRLRAGVVFVDTPGVGSLARSGARESYAYLPRCDLGILLLDAATSPGREDMDILRLLYESGIPGMAVLSKSDLLSEEDRARMRDYVKAEIAKNLGLDLPVHTVSAVGAAHLAHTWFANEILPLCERAGELAEASGRRKLGALRESVAASLRTLLSTGPETGTAETPLDRVEIERLALEAEGSIQEATRRCESLLSRTRDLARPTLELAAREIARRASPGQEPPSAKPIVRQAITDTATSIRAKIREDLLATRETLRETLAEMARRFDWAGAKPEDLGVDLVTQPSMTVPPEVERSNIRLPSWLMRFPSLLENRMRRQLLAQLEQSVAGAYASFSSNLRGWLMAAFADLASRFTAQAEPLRAQARRAAEGSGAVDPEGIAADLAEIEEPPVRGEQSQVSANRSSR